MASSPVQEGAMAVYHDDGDDDDDGNGNGNGLHEASEEKNRAWSLCVCLLFLLF